MTATNSDNHKIVLAVIALAVIVMVCGRHCIGSAYVAVERLYLQV